MEKIVSSPATEWRFLRVYRLVRLPPRLVQEPFAAYGALERFLVMGEVDGDVVRLERRRVLEGAAALVALKLSTNVTRTDARVTWAWGKSEWRPLPIAVD